MGRSKPSRDEVLSKLRSIGGDPEKFRSWMNGKLSSAKGTPWEGSVTFYTTRFLNACTYDINTRKYMPNEGLFDQAYAQFAQEFHQFETAASEEKAKKKGLFARLKGKFRKKGAAEDEGPEHEGAGANTSSGESSASATANVTINNAAAAAGGVAAAEREDAKKEAALEEEVKGEEKEISEAKREAEKAMSMAEATEQETRKEVDDLLEKELKGMGINVRGKSGNAPIIGYAAPDQNLQAQAAESVAKNSAIEREATAAKAKEDEKGSAMASVGTVAAMAAGQPELAPVISAVASAKTSAKKNAIDKKASKKKEDEEYKPHAAISTSRGFILLIGLGGILLYAIGIASALIGMLCLAITILLLFLAGRDFASKRGMFFLAAFMVHVVLVKMFYSGSAIDINTILLVSFGAYFTFAVVYFIFSRGDDAGETLKTILFLMVISLLVYMLPYVFTKWYVDADLMQYSMYVSILISPWLIYLLRQMREEDENGTGAALLRAYTLVVIALPFIIIMLFSFTKIMAMLPSASGSGADGKTALETSYDKLKTMATATYQRWSGQLNNIQNPTAYYTGLVEQNSDPKKAPLGVQVVTFNPVDKVVTNESDIQFVGEVYAKSFLGESIRVSPTCTIEKKGAPPAKVDPQEMEVIFGTRQGFQCTFPPMPKGSYSVKSSAAFPFETWSYIPYTFVDEERARNIARNGKDIGTILQIPTDIKATYTVGPIQLGMGGSSNPILVRPDKVPILPPGSQIGLTLESGWETGGKINRVNKILLKVPAPFVLQNCTRNLTQEPFQDDKDPSYFNYAFENREMSAQTSWQSITCRLDIPAERADDARLLVSNGDKTVRSFVAVVNYDYAIEKKSTIQVQ